MAWNPEQYDQGTSAYNQWGPQEESAQGFEDASSTFYPEDDPASAEAWAGSHYRPQQQVHSQQILLKTSLTTSSKVAPSYDGRSSWFRFEEITDEWVALTELDVSKQGISLKPRLDGDALTYRKRLIHDRLAQEDGVEYFKKTLRPFFVKGKINVFMWRFMQLIGCRRQGRDWRPWLAYMNDIREKDGPDARFSWSK